VNFRILGAILKKDVLTLAPLLALTALLFLADPLIVRLDLLPAWPLYNAPVVLVALVVLVLSVFQLDSPASLTDDWLCRPVPKRELLGAKLLLVLGVVYLPRAIGAFAADVSLGFPVGESLLDAVLLQDEITLFVLPFLLFAAIITRTFIQGFGVLFGILICVFVVPTPFVRPPGPLSPGIREALLASGMQWLATTPARLVSLALVVAGCWLVYWRRSVASARILMALAVCVALLFVLLPMGLAPWNATFAVQQALGPEPADTSRVYLRNPGTCFPAGHLRDLSTSAALLAATRGRTLWEEEALRDVGPASLAFFTAIEPRGLPLDWRVKLNYVQADYSAGGARLYSLRPASYITDQNGGGSLRHAWMLPEGAVPPLRGAQPRLDLTYSLTLLKPREYRVATDGRRHVLPGLGYCGAKVDEPGNRVDVDCFAAFTQAAQISAELDEIPATRVYGPVEFAPSWAKWPYGTRTKLAIGSARLARHDTITVTAWGMAGHIQRSLALPGILGADLQTCPLPDLEDTGFQKASWRDAAPHEAHSISVEKGVQLEVLDFGGQGTPMLLLPGLGATAHSFDELAPQLARKHRVVAMTRRGAGYSGKPDFGYDTARLSQDVLEVMSAMELDKVVLVGHSIAGDELTWLGGHHPERFAGLVYLDAAYDRSRVENERSRYRELNRSLPPEPPLPPAAMRNYASLSRLMEERGHVRYPEGELIAFLRAGDPYLAGVPSIDERTQQAISAAIEAPDYAAVKVPALAVYAFADPHQPLPPWYDASDKSLMATLAEMARIRDASKRASIEQFKAGVAHGQVLEMPNAMHSIIQSNQAEVLEAIESFALRLR
jgi:pimeloyl-ACP methyl ester carboxylesterase